VLGELSIVSFRSDPSFLHHRFKDFLGELRRCKIAVYRIPAAFIALLDVCFE